MLFAIQTMGPSMVMYYDDLNCSSFPQEMIGSKWGPLDRVSSNEWAQIQDQYNLNTSLPVVYHALKF